MPKFQVAGFQNKRDIRHRSLEYSSVYFYSDIYRSRWLGGFLPLTAANVCKQIDAFLWSLKSAKRLNPNAFMDCKTLNVKYCLKCPTCGKHYIGRKKAQRTHKSPQTKDTTDTGPICKKYALLLTLCQLWWR